ncbi:prokineticin domain-containing protein [Caerostris extrusa]|uniref:Prokineticin domain-containing protein n=1 Tax=Caerostris extrusa TaxID=172846 RepID=A0AAV4PS34_CAEEX|nr:prokineticin domain-containing protein [Caerostris extrusa]
MEADTKKLQKEIFGSGNNSDDDCEAGECCVAPGIFEYKKGTCKKLATKGEMCNEEDDNPGFFDVKYIDNCPCASGLTCEAKETKDLPFVGKIKIDERCV